MKRKIVGFDRKIERDWWEFAVGLAAQGLPEQEMRERLWNFLDGRVSAGSSGWNSDRGKVITVLMRIWGPAAGRRESMRQRALDVLRSSSSEDRVAIHWALCLAAYPFFTDVARVVGKHLQLHGEVQLSELRRRLIEAWGDRAVTKNASQRIVRSMVDWGVLRDAPSRGVFLAAPREAAQGRVASLLAEGLLLSVDSEGLPLEHVVSSPALYPFELALARLDLGRGETALSLRREGLDTEYVSLAP